jgi:hypothetical protein
MKIQWLYMVALTALLAACGGGGDSANGTDTTAQLIDKYVGTWKSACGPSDIKQVTSTGDLDANTRTSLTFTKLTPTTANVALTITVYGNSDTTCSGTAIGSIVKTGLTTGSESSGASGVISSFGQNVWTVAANVALAAGKKVDQISYSESKLSMLVSGSGNASITAGAIKFNANDYAAQTTKLLGFFPDAKTLEITVSDDNSFPTEFTADVTLSKQ